MSDVLGFVRRAAQVLAVVSLVLGPAAGPSMAAVPDAERNFDALAADLARIEAYLDDLDRLQAGFVQIAHNGRRSTGTLYLDRPSRMRLDYDPPNRIQIVAADGRIDYHDPDLQQISNIAVGRTPLGFLLADEIRLDGDVTVTGFAREGDELWLSVVQTENPAQGELTLIFADEPLQLRRWIVIDAQGLRTEVTLHGIETDVRFARDHFVFRDPRMFGESWR